jgi:two-component system sensor histidine kinase/response regulator
LASQFRRQKRVMIMEDKAKILIIDDEEVVLDSCTQILADRGFQISTTNDGSKGLELIDSIRPDLVVVDLKMPGISGFEVVKKIQEIDPTIVSVVITGFATVSSAVEAMKLGAYDFLPKPFTPDELRLITKRGLEKRRLILETIALRREKELLRDHFAAMVSHELISPLSSLQQNIYVLKQELPDTLTDEQFQRLGRIQSRVEDLLKLIQTWLRVISVDINKIQESFGPVEVSSIISKAVESLQTQATRKDIDILLSVEEPIKPVYGDEGTLVEALINIIGNAVKYSHMGSQVLVSAEESGDGVLIIVKDRGVGIPAEDLPFIFDGFHVGTSATAGEKSHGLGLAITHKIIEAHNGMINVESEMGKGSIFVIRLPTSE